MTAIIYTARSSNSKTGPIPVTTSSSETCPDACPLKAGGCYAKNGAVSWLWKALDKAGPNAEFKSGVATVRSTYWSGMVASITTLPSGQLWRHNQAGDLPHADQVIDAAALKSLVKANSGKRGFTYTHHDVTIASNAAAVAMANMQGFTVNLSANNLAHADQLMALDIGPVVTLLPAEIEGNVTVSTPAGHRVVVCPATYRDDVNCASCGLCQRSERNIIVGFPAHGARKNAASAIAA